MQATDAITVLKGVGEKTAALFQKVGLHSVRDVLYYYPRTYDTYEKPVPIASLIEGKVQTIEASVVKVTQTPQKNKKQLLMCIVQDPSGNIKLTWFNQPYMKNNLQFGKRILFRGRVTKYNGALTLEQPKLYGREEYARLLTVLQPIYSLTDGLTNRAVSKAVEQALIVAEEEEELIPRRILREQKWMSKKDALREIHFPKAKDTMLEARERLVFEEFFRFMIQLRRWKDVKGREENHHRLQAGEKTEALLRALPYALTGAQSRVLSEIKKDLNGPYVMSRLVQGDVGSGKTVLALVALCITAENGMQGAIMVPTEVLAEQHYEEAKKLLEPLGIRVTLLTGSMTAAKKRKLYAEIAAQETDIIIGTHALIQEKVQYANLALVITDEQHRFGVKQRESFSGKGEKPHILVMSATPIPRTLAMILYGDLDISLVDELPADRLKIKNCVVGTEYRETAYRFIKGQVNEGRQAYVICPMVAESEQMEAENVIDYAETLQEALGEGICVAYLHGKLRPKEKNAIMERFAAGEIQVLVSTTVVEVGVNVPNATVMMIENAERFGLAQLHQLRGRVGRGKYQSYCIMVAVLKNDETMERLSIMNHSNDGFYIAEEDLKLRGPGDLFGIRQSGELEFKIADIYQDAELLKLANEAVSTLSKQELAGIYDVLQKENGEEARSLEETI